MSDQKKLSRLDEHILRQAQHKYDEMETSLKRVKGMISFLNDLAPKEKIKCTDDQNFAMKNVTFHAYQLLDVLETLYKEFLKGD